MRRKAFSLLELMLVMALLAVTTMSLLISTRQSVGRATARGLAAVLSEQFRLARQQAVTRQYPVALCFPSNTGTQGHTAAYYVLQGETLPKITDSRDYQGEYPRAAAFIGVWPVSSGTLGRRLPVPGSTPAVDLDAWLPAGSKKDYCFVYQPDGSLVTNDLPSYDGAYHVLVAAGLTSAGAGAPPGAATVSPGPSYFSVSEVGEAYTLTISPGGGVTLVKGVANSTVPERSGALALSAPAPPPARPAPTANDPVVEAINFSPQPNAATLPPDTDTVIGPDDFVTLESIAHDPDGDQLYCIWNVRPLSGTGPGTFSFPGSQGRMSWDPNYVRRDGNKGAWRAVWQWRPPPEVTGAERFELVCQVAQEGAPPITAEIRKIQTLPPGNILFETSRRGIFETFTMRRDGSQQKPLEHNMPQSAQPAANTDGTRVVFMSAGDLYLLRKPLNIAEQLTNTVALENMPALTPTGNMVAFRRGPQVIVMETTAGGRELLVDTVVGAPRRCGVDPTDIDRMSWDPSGTHLLYTKGDRIWKADIDPAPTGPALAGGPALFTTATAAAQAAFWSQDGNTVYYTNHDGDPYVWTCNNAGGGDAVYSFSPGISDHQPYRDPTSPSLVLARHPVGVNNLEIWRSDGPGNFIQLTSAGGINTYPSWTR